jgi:predicted nucleic acid-binding Zn ribbon protein
MTRISVQNVFRKCRKCGTVNRVVAAGLSEAQVVNCSQCGAAMGQWGVLKLIANADGAGASWFRSGSDRQPSA